MNRFMKGGTIATWLALSAVPCLAVAQARRIVGRVSGSAGESIAGANVSAVAAPTGVATDETGRFIITVPSGTTALIVRHIGYHRREVTLAPGSDSVTVVLQRDVLELERLVVTGVATTVSSQNAANDVAHVDADAVRQVSTPSLESVLSGRASGVQVLANSGAPGGGNQVRIRGVNSVFGAATPLYVIDGVLVSDVTIQSGLNALSGANGGNNASNQDNGVNHIADLNPNDIESIDVLKGASASAIYGARGTNGVIVVTTRRGRAGTTHVEVQQRVGTFDLANTLGTHKFTLDEAIQQGADVGLSEADVRASYAACNGKCDYERELFGEHPLAHETTVSLTGGSGATRYFLSGIDHYDGGIERNTDYRKQGARLNLDQPIGSRASLAFNSNVVKTSTRRGYTNNDNISASPYIVIGATPSWFDMRPTNGVYPRNPFIGSGANIFQTRDLVNTPEDGLRFIGGATLDVTAFSTEHQSLALRVDGGYDRLNQTDNITARSDLFWESADGLPGTVTYQNATNALTTLNATAIHAYTPASNLFKTTTSLGVQRTITDFTSGNSVSRNVPFGLTTPGSGTTNFVFGTHTLIRDFAVFAAEDFLAWNERLALGAAIRAERSTVNGDFDKYYAYPKASASLRVGSVGNVLGDVKLRTAVGRAGNQPLYADQYSPAISSAYTGENAFRVGTTLGNNHIRPEVTTEVEGGADASLFGDFGSISVTAYQRTTNDVILRIATAPSLGFTQAIRNGGQFRNRGTEISLQLNPVARPDLTWIARTTFARNIGVTTALPADIPSTGFALPNGFGAGFGQGQLQVGKPITQIVFAGADGQLVTAGDQAPDFTMGFANDVTIKGVRLSSVFDWQRGGDLVNLTQNIFDASGHSADVADGGLDRADQTDRPTYVQNAGFVKLRELSVSYPLPTALVHRAFGKIDGARLEVSGRNLKTWTSYKGLDPEVSNFGSQAAFRAIDVAPFPPSRSFFFGLGVNF